MTDRQGVRYFWREETGDGELAWRQRLHLNVLNCTCGPPGFALSEANQCEQFKMAHYFDDFYMIDGERYDY